MTTAKRLPADGGIPSIFLLGVNLAAWNRYRVGSVSTRKNWTNSACQPFDTIGHVAHLDVAINIVRENKIKPGLVFDKSRLNDSRILVAWLSPNFWANGFRYGSVKFDFNFRELVDGKRAYWVEVIDYQPAACRILITDQDHSSTLLPYDPTVGDGPWWFDCSTNKDYFNGNYCLEFMFEEEIGVESLCDLSFVNHHSEFCSMHRNDPGRCNEKGTLAGIAGAIFLSKVVASALDFSAIAQLWASDTGHLNHHFTHALSYVARRITKNCGFTGKLKFSDAASISVARAVMNATAIDRRSETVALADLFESEEELLKTVAELIDDAFSSNQSAKIFHAMMT